MNDIYTIIFTYAVPTIALAIQIWSEFRKSKEYVEIVNQLNQQNIQYNVSDNGTINIVHNYSTHNFVEQYNKKLRNTLTLSKWFKLGYNFYLLFSIALYCVLIIQPKYDELSKLPLLTIVDSKKSAIVEGFNLLIENHHIFINHLIILLSVTILIYVIKQYFKHRKILFKIVFHSVVALLYLSLIHLNHRIIFQKYILPWNKNAMFVLSEQQYFIIITLLFIFILSFAIAYYIDRILNLSPFISTESDIEEKGKLLLTNISLFSIPIIIWILHYI